MSGGSYEYLQSMELDDFIRTEEQLLRMRDRLSGLGYAEDAALETERLIQMLRQAKVRLSVKIERLGPVWKAVEWWDSGDSGEDQVKSALKEYRGE